MNATYSALTFTVSQYGAYSMVSDILMQEGFEGEYAKKEAVGGDDEMAKAVKKWEEHFGIKRDVAPWPWNPVPLTTAKLPILETMVGSLAMPAKDALRELGYDDPEVLRQQRMDEDANQ